MESFQNFFQVLEHNLIHEVLFLLLKMGNFLTDNGDERNENEEDLLLPFKLSSYNGRYFFNRFNY